MSDKAKARDTWISEPGFRHFFTDAAGVDHDILDLVELKKQVEASAGVACPNCDDEGWYPERGSDGEAEQVQCEFCYMVPNSIFNRRLADKG